MGMIQEYVVGFMFDAAMDKVVLMKKEHGPRAVLGRWNGVGGKIEMGKQHVAEQDDVFGKGNCTCGCQDGELPKDAMIREFFEETGVHTQCKEWNKFTELCGEDFIVHCFWGQNDYIANAVETKTDEEVRIVPVRAVPYLPLCPCVNWFVQFLTDRTCHNRLGAIYTTYKKDDATTSLQT
jgi:8-oxo-dGTP pyrophosphatase MutT (NUDIX family)